MIRNFSKLLLLSFITLLGCSGQSSQLPSGPDGGGSDPTLRYCRVVEINSMMHVQWAADRRTRGEIRYGRSALTQSVSVPMLSDSHDVTLTSLQYNSGYIYRILVSDSLGNEIQCDGQFMTPVKATPEPIISDLTIAQVTERSAIISWVTDEPATSILKYGLSAATDSLVNDSFAVSHSMVLSNLTPATFYWIEPQAVDTEGLRGIGTDSLFRTAARLTLYYPDMQMNLGDTIQLPIYLTEAQDLAALQYQLDFESGLEIISVDEGPFYTDHNGFAFFRAIRPSLSMITNQITWSIQYNGNTRVGTEADGNGVIAYINLRGINPGSVNGVFTADSTYGLDIFATLRSCSLSTGTITVNP